MLVREAFAKISRDRLIRVCFVVIVLSIILALLSLVPGLCGDPEKEVVGRDETTLIDRSYHPPSLLIALSKEVHGRPLSPEQAERFEGGLFSAAAWKLPCGCDIKGRSVLGMSLHGLRMAFLVGLVTTTIAILIAIPVGAVAGYFGGFIDDLIVWFYTTLVSIPQLLLLIALASAIAANNTAGEKSDFASLMIVLVVLGLTMWVELARLIRAEFMKHKSRDYVQAARAMGFGHGRIIFSHILPNVSHIVIISFTINFVIAINIEVFLSFIGVGIPPTAATWGATISKAKDELARDPSVWWPLTTATLFLFIISLAFSIVGDALRDALDPKLRTR